MGLMSVTRLVGIAALAVPAVTACQGSDVANSEDEVLARTNDLAAAWIELDPDRYLAYFADDVVFYFEGQRLGRDIFDAGVRASMGALRSVDVRGTRPACTGSRRRRG
jgi:hypothetical protein